MQNTFQVVIATDGVQTYVIFNYLSIQWGERGATIGFNAGDGINFLNLLTPASVGMFLAPHFTPTDSSSWKTSRPGL